MRVLFVEPLPHVNGWKATILANDAMGELWVEAQRLDDSPWMMTNLGGREVPPEHAEIRQGTQIWPLLQQAVKDYEAGRTPGVTPQERRELLG